MKEIVPVLNVFLSGFFGLSVALLTWRLSLQREKSKHRREILADDYKKIEEFYTSCLALIYKEINNVRNNGDYNTLNEFGLIAAQAAILTDEEFNNNLLTVTQKLSLWSYNYKMGLPKKVGDTGLLMISTADKQFTDKAKSYYDELDKELNKFVEIIKSQLKSKKAAQMRSD